MKHVLRTAAALLAINASVQAQTWTYFGLFPQYSQTGNVSKRLNYNAFISSTVDPFHKSTETKYFPTSDLQLYLQPSLHYKLTPNTQLGIGYAHVRHHLFGLYVNENRVWAQAVSSLPLGKGRLTHRLRYEERYPLNLKTKQWSYAQLFRYHVGFTLPLYNPKEQKKGPFVSVSNEAFLCLSGARNSPVSSKNAFYGENWISGGIGYNFGNQLGKLELGYNYQDLIRNKAGDHRHLHLAQITWSTNFTLENLGVWLLTPPY
ncbi:DUF2490 domain-containing protein [Rudanella lutea]|uniref:DUF2490 domain-containing protein n=1 Tax=Rudanella lutea TaxID=451374 RepID=UPI00036B3936|nr:DUF2490 domain-containing protein [Rudanella lutea]